MLKARTEEKKICRKPGCGLIHEPSVPCWRARMAKNAQHASVNSHRLIPSSSGSRVAMTIQLQG